MTYTVPCNCVNKWKSTMVPALEIDTELLNEAQRIGGLKTKKDTAHSALKKFIKRRKQTAIGDLFGKMDPETLYDYKRG